MNQMNRQMMKTIINEDRPRKSAIGEESRKRRATTRKQASFWWYALGVTVASASRRGLKHEFRQELYTRETLGVPIDSRRVRALRLWNRRTHVRGAAELENW